MARDRMRLCVTLWLIADLFACSDDERRSHACPPGAGAECDPNTNDEDGMIDRRDWYDAAARGDASVLDAAADSTDGEEPDASGDAATDSGMHAGMDAGQDASSDAGDDAGEDASIDPADACDHECTLGAFACSDG